MSSMIQLLRNNLEQKKGERKRIKEDLAAHQRQSRMFTKKERRARKAQQIIQTVAKETQNQLSYHISELVSLALKSIFPDPYKLKLEFVPKRGGSEAVLAFEREREEPVHPMSATGGGPIDVASFALRVALHSIQTGRPRKTIILDEPFKNLSAEYQPLASSLLKEVSERLEIQIIMVSHNETLINSADKVFKVSKRKSVSKVQTMKDGKGAG